MAEVFRTMNGVKTEKALAYLPSVGVGLDRAQAEIAANARALLEEVHAEPDYTGDGDSRITTSRGKVDRYVELNDERGDEAAAAIEFGRSGFSYQRRTKDGHTITVHVGPAEGKFILTRASGIGKRGRRR